MRPLFACLAFAAACCAPVHAADVAHEADTAAIRQVVQQFQDAIRSHDGKTLGSLFLPNHDSWLSVLDDASYAAAKARNPAAGKVVRSTSQAFANFVQTSPKPVEERFYNVRIDTNGAVASVYFDFDFLVDGKVNNRGSETWQMVRAEDGWKISSMLYSVGR
jgi:ketosteroid isomerase-like protein